MVDTVAVAAASPAGRTQAAGAAAILPRPTVDILEAVEASRLRPTEGTLEAAKDLALRPTVGTTAEVPVMAATTAALMAVAGTATAVGGTLPAGSTKAKATTTAGGFGLVRISV